MPPQFRLFLCLYRRSLRHFSPFYSSHPKPLLGGFRLRDYFILIYLVLWFFPLLWVIFDVKTVKIETELSPTFTAFLCNSNDFDSL